MANQRYLVTSALPYANGRLHVGHIAGAYLPADTYVRYLRRKLGAASTLIQTVRGIGYRLNDRS